MVAEILDTSTRWVVFISGELDLMTGPSLDARLDRLMSTGAVGLVLDLHGITFMDAYGLRSLVRAHNRYDGRLAWQRPSGRVRRVLEVAGLLEWLPILPDDVAWSSEPQRDGCVRLRLDLCADAY